MVARTEEAKVPNEKLPTRYGVTARRKHGGFVAEYQMPAMKPVTVMADGEPAIFPTYEEAIAAAGHHMRENLNARTKSRTKHGTVRLGGADLAFALRSADLSPTQFARIFGTKQARVLDWIDGAEDIPHAARILLALLHLPGARKMAMEITDNVTIRQEAAE